MSRIRATCVKLIPNRVRQLIRGFGWVEVEGPTSSLTECRYLQTDDFSVENVFVIQPFGMVVRWPSTILLECQHLHKEVHLKKPFSLWFFASVLGGKYDRLEEASLGMHAYCGAEYNHFHALVDVIPRVFNFFFRNNFQGTPILVNRTFYESELFNHCQMVIPGLGDQCVVGKYSITKVGLLHVCNRPGFDLAKLSEISQKISTGCDPNPVRKTYIDREPDSKRSLGNRDEVRRVLVDLGFEVVSFDRMSMADQIKTIAQSRHIVAQHGAGMANLIFHLSGQLSVIELKPPSKQYDNCYEEISQSMGFDYRSVVGESISGGDGFNIDATTLVKAVKEFDEK